MLLSAQVHWRWVHRRQRLQLRSGGNSGRYCVYNPCFNATACNFNPELDLERRSMRICSRPLRFDFSFASDYLRRVSVVQASACNYDAERHVWDNNVLTTIPCLCLGAAISRATSTPSGVQQWHVRFLVVRRVHVAFCVHNDPGESSCAFLVARTLKPPTAIPTR